MLIPNAIPFPRRPGAYLVGGCVRDALLGREPADYDIAVETEPDRYAAELAEKTGGRAVRLGPVDHPLFRVVTPDLAVDIQPLLGGSIDADLRQRDFTVNAMAIAIGDRRLVDPTGGRADLKRQRIRMVSPTAFQRDPVRLVRAFRMAAALGFSVESRTLDAISHLKSGIGRSAGERIQAELEKLFATGSAAPQVRRMADVELLFALFPEMTPLRGCLQNLHHHFDVLDHTLQTLARLETLLSDPPADLAGLSRRVRAEAGTAVNLHWAVLFHDLGKPVTRRETETGAVVFRGHDRRGAALAGSITDRLRFSRKTSAAVLSLIALHLRPLWLFLSHRRGTLTVRGITRCFIRCGELTPALLVHAAADHLGKVPGAAVPAADPFLSFIADLHHRFINRFEVRRREPPLITGHDLIRELGISPSPLVGRLLKRLETERMAGEITTRQAALRRASKWLTEISDP